MTDTDFRSRVAEAEACADADYRAGYLRGLRRLHHGEAFGTAEEHALWMAPSDTPDQGRQRALQGYADGFAGRRPVHAP